MHAFSDVKGSDIASGLAAEDLMEELRAGEVESGGAEGGPDEAGGGDHGEVAEMAAVDGQEACGGVGSGKADAGGEQGTG
jgi:hypothetical protein